MRFWILDFHCHLWSVSGTVRNVKLIDRFGKRK
jgi:hypothetical protein